jgi:hypothetical protein
MPITRWGLATCTLTSVMSMIRPSRVGSRSAGIVTANSRDAQRYFCRGLTGERVRSDWSIAGRAVRRKKVPSSPLRLRVNICPVASSNVPQVFSGPQQPWSAGLAW